ncbi:MAG: hypothetical protein JSU05_00450 [Bacteroidetes bacterium]|nr:hypothetical protein [Bacteroidota bacterium]
MPKQSKPATKKTLTLPPPDMEWQTGAYDRHASFAFILPYPFLLVCKLLEVTPEELLLDFMDHLAFSSWKRTGKETARTHLTEYFMAHGYGQQLYTPEDIRFILRELEALSLVWPDKCAMEFTELSSEWRKEYYHYWFNKWFEKPRRKL